MLGVPAADDAAPKVHELGGGELPDDLELPHTPAANLGEALVHQGAEHVDRRARHHHRGVELGAADEGGEPAKRLLLVVIK